MNTKTKHFSLSGLAYALVLILLATTMVGIVAYAAGSKTHNIGGNVSFTADGIEATIGVGSTTGGSTTKKSGDVMQEIIFSTTQSKDTYSANYSTWSDLEVTIDAPTDGSSTASATISFEVTNNSTTDMLEVSLTSSSAGEAVTEDNAITVTTSLDDVPTYIGYESGSNTATISVTFTVADADYNAEISGFSVELKLAKAETYSSNSITYALNSTENTATVVSYDGDGGEVTVADTVSVEEAAAESVSATASEQKIAAFANATDAEENQAISAQSTSYSVTAIAAKAFSGTNCSSITSLTLSSNLTAIGASAFTGCSAITTLTIPKTVTAIGKSAFSGCEALETIINKSSCDMSEENFSAFGLDSQKTQVSTIKTIKISKNEPDTCNYAVDGENEWLSYNSGDEVQASSKILITLRGWLSNDGISGFGDIEEKGYWDVDSNTIEEIWNSAAITEYYRYTYSVIVNGQEVDTRYVSMDGSAYSYYIVLDVTEDMEVDIYYTGDCGSVLGYPWLDTGRQVYAENILGVIDDCDGLTISVNETDYISSEGRFYGVESVQLRLDVTYYSYVITLSTGEVLTFDLNDYTDTKEISYYYTEEDEDGNSTTCTGYTTHYYAYSDVLTIDQYTKISVQATKRASD